MHTHVIVYDHMHAQKSKEFCFIRCISDEKSKMPISDKSNWDLRTRCHNVKNAAKKFNFHLDVVIVGKHFVLRMCVQETIDVQSCMRWALAKCQGPGNLCLLSLCSA